VCAVHQARLNERSHHRSRLISVLGRTSLVLALLVRAQGVVAADCPPLREPRIPHIAGPMDPIDPVNIDKVKTQLKDYQAGNYEYDVAAVLADARIYLDRRLKIPVKSAVVLDIDETSLSNWPNLKADDFGLIQGIPCKEVATDGPCGFNQWVLAAQAQPIVPTRDFFNAAIRKGVAVFFITGRRENQRAKTVENLEKAEFKGYSKLFMRSDDDTVDSIVPFKSGQRTNIEKEGYTIIANIGDQRSDLAGDAAGDHAECTFKVPNPFYFIP